MSNYLAIATVTATLQRILQTAIQQDIAQYGSVKGREGSTKPGISNNTFAIFEG
jgi:hypothetical protein